MREVRMRQNQNPPVETAIRAPDVCMLVPIDFSEHDRYSKTALSISRLRSAVAPGWMANSSQLYSRYQLERPSALATFEFRVGR